MGVAKARKQKGGTPAVALLEASGRPFTVHEFEHDPAVRSYGLEAAAAMGASTDRVFKTLVVNVDGSLAVAIVPVDRQLSMKAVAAALGAKRAELADQGAAERSTGYVRGGISPLGQKRRLPTVLDERAFEHETVLVSGGRRGLELELAPADLAALLDARSAAIGV